MKENMRVIVVGSGIAGLIAALRLSKRFDVTVVTKSELAESNTRWAQGGIAAAMFPDDSVAEHIADTLRAGAGLCSVKAVEVLCSEGPARIHDLVNLGVSFDLQDGNFARGLEAAHSHPRVLHASGDATGLTIETALVQAIHRSGISVMENTFASDLLLDCDRVVGLHVMDSAGNKNTLEAEAVIIASGGAGQLYSHTTNPRGATGDGIALAMRASAQIADAEFYQFHPTALASSEPFLISEAVRGEGAVLLDAEGRPFMHAIHPDGDLAPRDVVARAIAAQMRAQDGKFVSLDATAFGADFLRKRFPSIDAACRRRGLDWANQPIPVTPAAHYWMGGIRTDLLGRTNVDGLFAIGEAACTGVHGANRLASNSLLESLVFAWRCADYLLEGGPVRFDHSAQGSEPSPNSFLCEPEEGGPSQATDRASIQKLMWSAAGIERNGADLKAALKTLASWRVPGSDVQSLETANLLALARLLTTAALARCESRGAHYRADYPDVSPLWQHSLLYATAVPAPC